MSALGKSLHKLLRPRLPAALRRAPVRLSVRLRLTLLYGGLFLAAGTALLAVNYAFVERGLDSRELRVAVNGDDVGTAEGRDATTKGFVFRPPRQDLTMLTAPSSDLTPQQQLWIARVYEALDLTPEQREALETSSQALPMTEHQRADVAQQLEDFRQQVQDDTLAELLTWSGVALVIMAVVSVALGWVVAGRVLHPLKRITATARRLSGSNLHERINLLGPRDELKELADTFDQMLDRLDASFASQRRFVANASHELRTPLSIVRTEVDVALADPDTTTDQLRATAERVGAATERSERLIDSLLMLARSERRPETHDPVDLGSAAGDALDAVDREIRERGFHVETDLSEAVVAGDRPLLERLVANLVENAVRHNVEGGWIRVTTGATGRRLRGWDTEGGRSIAGEMGRGCAGVVVANGGAVLTQDEVNGLFEPFRRRTRARTGTDRGAGLGLSIVRAVAETHGGQVRARPLPGGGLEVLAVLPAFPVGASGYAGSGAATTTAH